MPGDKGGKTKHDRCVEGVEEGSPDVKNPHAVCVATGVKPEKWKKVNKSHEVLKIDNRGQWSMEKQVLGGVGAGSPPGPTQGASTQLNPDNLNTSGFQMSEVVKDDKPHPPGSPKDSAHDVKEEGSNFKEEINELSDEGKRSMLAHLRTLRGDTKNWKRSPENKAAGKD